MQINSDGILNMNGNWDIARGNFGYTKLADRVVNNYLNSDGLATNYDTSMASAFKKFQETFTSNELSKMISGGWCLADNAYASESSNITADMLLSKEEKENYYLNGGRYYFDTFVRLRGNSPKQPTLKCNGTIMNKFGDNKTEMYVGTLTLDEIVYAGSNANTGAMAYYHDYYLLNNYATTNYKYWWTLSPAFYGDGNYHFEWIFNIGNDGHHYQAYIGVDHYLRPAVSLKADIKLISGDGTQKKPYVVE